MYAIYLQLNDNNFYPAVVSPEESNGNAIFVSFLMLAFVRKQLLVLFEMQLDGTL